MRRNGCCERCGGEDTWDEGGEAYASPARRGRPPNYTPGGGGQGSPPWMMQVPSFGEVRWMLDVGRPSCRGALEGSQDKEAGPRIADVG